MGSRKGQTSSEGISDTTILWHPPAHCQPRLRGQSDEWREEESLGCLSWPLLGGWAKLCSESSLHAPSPVSPQMLIKDLYSFFTPLSQPRNIVQSLCADELHEIWESSHQCIFETLSSHVNSCDSKSPNMRRTVTAPVCKDEVQLAAEVHPSSQGSTKVPSVSHSRDDVVRQQLICF